VRVDARLAATLYAVLASARPLLAAALPALIPSATPGGNPVMEVASLGKIPMRPLTTVEPVLVITVEAKIP
jgi:hypothetical protein